MCLWPQVSPVGGGGQQTEAPRLLPHLVKPSSGFFLSAFRRRKSYLTRGLSTRGDWMVTVTSQFWLPCPGHRSQCERRPTFSELPPLFVFHRVTGLTPLTLKDGHGGENSICRPICTSFGRELVIFHCLSSSNCLVRETKQILFHWREGVSYFVKQKWKINVI